MPLSVLDLQPGDRVILNCPKARLATKREAIFEGIYSSAQTAGTVDDATAVLISAPSEEFLASGTCARKKAAASL